MSKDTQIIAAENCHWYTKDGAACYEVPCSTKDGMRPTNIKDARKLNLVPSFTLIKDQISKPGLELWKLNQLLAAALTLPRLDNEPPDDFARRVVNDYKQEGQKAAERGKELHIAIELASANGEKAYDEKWNKHISSVFSALSKHGIDLTSGSTEHSFASELGYGGKIDWHHDSGVILDIKSKDKIDNSKQLVWDEHVMQCAAYGFGLWPNRKFRGLNVFVGVQDCEVRVLEHEWEDLERGFGMFKCLLEFWKLKNHF